MLVLGGLHLPDFCMHLLIKIVFLKRQQSFILCNNLAVAHRFEKQRTFALKVNHLFTTWGIP